MDRSMLTIAAACMEPLLDGLRRWPACMAEADYVLLLWCMEPSLGDSSTAHNHDGDIPVARQSCIACCVCHSALLGVPDAILSLCWVMSRTVHLQAEAENQQVLQDQLKKIAQGTAQLTEYFTPQDIDYLNHCDDCYEFNGRGEAPPRCLLVHEMEKAVGQLLRPCFWRHVYCSCLHVSCVVTTLYTCAYTVLAGHVSGQETCFTLVQHVS